MKKPLRYKGENGIMKKKFTVNQQLEEHAERSSPEWRRPRI